MCQSIYIKDSTHIQDKILIYIKVMFITEYNFKIEKCHKYSITKNGQVKMLTKVIFNW